MQSQFDNNFRKKISKNFMVKHLLFCVFTFSMIATLTFFLLKHLKPSHAIDFSNFKPGNIISDNTMSDTDTMDEVSIQKFLTKINSCNDYNISKAAKYPAYKYHIENGHFVCLSQETFENNGQKQTAAQIIFEASRDYVINPQVLIVLLEKEQGLITDTWPNHIQYRSATGFGCPDTAECDAKYYGFRNQVRNAAKLFREVLDGGYTNYPIGNNYILYNPNRSCGGSIVNIENRATSALYRYTPYQPNQSALANYPGTSYCGAYGNRNFYALFQKWFGDPNVSYFAPDSAYLLDGDYQITSLTNMVLANNQLNKGQDSTLIIKKQDNTKFTLKRNSDGFYYIINLSTKKVLSIEKNKLTFSELDNKGCSSKWSFQPVGENYVIQSACYNKAIDIYGGNINKDNNPVWLFNPNSTDSQKWKLLKVNDDNGVIKKDIYNFVSPENKAIDVINFGTINGTELQTYINAKNVAQQFEISPTKDGFYSIKNPNSNKVLDVFGGGRSNGTKVQLYDSNNTCSQKWFFSKNQEYYTIHSACSGKAIDSITGGIDGSKIKISDSKEGVSSQKWKLQDTDKKENHFSVEDNKNLENKENKTKLSSVSDIKDGQIYYISNVADQTKVIDVNYSGTSNGTNVHLYQKWGTNNKAQQWIIRKDNNGYFTFINPNSNKALDIASGFIHDRTNIWIYDQNNSCAQKWKLENQGEVFRILSACNDKMSLDLDYGKTNNGTNIQLYQKWGTDNKAQQWIIRKE